MKSPSIAEAKRCGAETAPRCVVTPSPDACLRRSLLVHEHHAFVVHGEGIAVEGSDCLAGAFPLHSEFRTFLGVGGADFARRFWAGLHGKDHLAGAGAVRVDGEAAGADLHGDAFVSYTRGQGLAVNGDYQPVVKVESCQNRPVPLPDTSRTHMRSK